MRDRSRKLGQIVVAINRAEQSLLQRVNQTLVAEGLNFSRLSILSIFLNQPNKNQTVSSLVAATGMNQPLVTKVVAYLSEQGWLHRETDSIDARSKKLKITPAGLTVTMKGYNLLSPELVSVFSELSDDEIDQLLGELNGLNSRLMI